MVLCGTKSDLREQAGGEGVPGVIGTAQGEEFAAKHGFNAYVECSAKRL